MSEERRRYFRITDRIFLSIRKLSEQEASEFYLINDDSLRDNIQSIDNQLMLALDKIRPGTPAVAEVIELLNRKIGCLMRNMTDIDSLNPAHTELTEVNLSACGISYPSKEQYRLEQPIEVDMWLPANDWRVKVLGYVSGCESQEEGGSKPYLIRVDFRNIEYNTQEILIQHLVKRQGQLIKNQIAVNM